MTLDDRQLKQRLTRFWDDEATASVDLANETTIQGRWRKRCRATQPW